MPQMSPLSWSLLTLVFSSLVLMTMILLFFFSPSTNKSDSKKSHENTIYTESPFKWMW